MLTAPAFLASLAVLASLCLQLSNRNFTFAAYSFAGTILCWLAGRAISARLGLAAGIISGTLLLVALVFPGLVGSVALTSLGVNVGASAWFSWWAGKKIAGINYWSGISSGIFALMALASLSLVGALFIGMSVNEICVILASGPGLKCPEKPRPLIEMLLR